MWVGIYSPEQHYIKISVKLQGENEKRGCSDFGTFPLFRLFGDYGTTINDYRATFNDFVTTIDFRLSTFGRLSDYPATIDFATISDFSDFRTDGGDPDRGGRLDVSMEMSRGSTFVAVSGVGCAVYPLRRRVSRREIGWIYRFWTFTGVSAAFDRFGVSLIGCFVPCVLRLLCGK